LTFNKVTDILSAGGVAVPAGSLAANSLRLVQVGTGIYQPSVNVLGLSANGVDVLRLNTATNGVNYIEITPQTTGGGSANGPTIKATGADSSVDLNFDTKGTSGRYQFKIGGSTKVDILNDGEVRTNGNFQLLSNAKYVGQSSTNIMFGNGGAWLELRANSVTTMKVTDSQVVVTGNLRLVPLASPPVICGGANTEGVYYTDTSHAFCYCNGTSWTNLTPADGGSCS
jgi:hypothetical protein